MILVDHLLLYNAQKLDKISSSYSNVLRNSLEGADSFGALSRFSLYSLHLYCTAYSSCLKVGLVLELNRSLQ